MYPWRAVDSEGEVLDFLIQPGRDEAAALKLMRKLLKTHGFAPRVVVTDKLRSYASAFRELRLSARHEQGVRKNNRAENSHSRSDGESEKCSASSPPVQLSAVSPSTPPSTTTSTSNVT